MMVAVVLGVYALYAVFDLLPTIRAGKRRLIWPCLLLFTLAAAVQVLHEINIRVPSPASLITDFVSGWFDIK